MKILLGLLLVALLVRAAYSNDRNGVRVFWIAAGIFALVAVIV